ncbi:hypothetical protein [Amycolatopsis kentuckyensis]|uniref:hypothetical protein n=1 Tax=Amycolatopsis kentuckyensis TaxID=218823 RepID=UPI000A3A3C9C|nr:hypothetical protein [Amycolatopsis kentuckyensis]
MTEPVADESGTRRQRRCDPRALDENECRNKGIAAQAAYNAEHAKEISDARAAYAGARARYVTARRRAQPLVKKARKDLDELFEKIRCQFDEEKQERLEQACGHVEERLERCGRGGCCGCGDDEDDPREESELGRRGAIELRIAEAKECFDRLIAEPGETEPAQGQSPVPDPASASVPGSTPAQASASAPVGVTLMSTSAVAENSGTPADPPRADDVVPLPQRVADLGREIDRIAEYLAKEEADPLSLYAAALVARLRLKNIWLGFHTVNDYVDCLCACLTTIVKGRASISLLVRRAAVEHCYRDSWKAACARLEKDALDEVIARYHRICARDDDHDHHHGNGGGYGDDQHGRDDDDDDDVETRVERDDDDDEPPRRPQARQATHPSAREPAPAPERRETRPRRPFVDDDGDFRAP